ncbi:MAG: HigA family addiction module antidote protein [Spirochaetales bacterium]|nr:HigA family addiction module antidote protein [Spirochaetales bacterium]
MVTKRISVHPGLLLKEDVLIPLKLSITEAAQYLGVTRKALSKLSNEKAFLNPDMAIRTAQATKTSGEIWLNMQSNLRKRGCRYISGFFQDYNRRPML